MSSELFALLWGFVRAADWMGLVRMMWELTSTSAAKWYNRHMTNATCASGAGERWTDIQNTQIAQNPNSSYGVRQSLLCVCLANHVVVVYRFVSLIGLRSCDSQTRFPFEHTNHSFGPIFSPSRMCLKCADADGEKINQHFPAINYGDLSAPMAIKDHDKWYIQPHIHELMLAYGHLPPSFGRPSRESLADSQIEKSTFRLSYAVPIIACRLSA